MLEALSFLGFALLHLGVRIAADFAVIDEPRRLFAVIVEGWPQSPSRWARPRSSRDGRGRGLRQLGRTPSPLQACSGGWSRSLPAEGPIPS
jgi:hypothetical protein